jgi:hypothetical protein
MPSALEPIAAAIKRPRGRPRKTAPAAARFAPIRLAQALGAPSGAAPFTPAFELLFPDGLALRVARDANPAALERLVGQLRRRGD